MYDAQVKYLVSNKQVLSRIMKFSVPEYKECSIEEIMSYIEGTPEVETHSILPENEKIEGMDTTSKVPGEGEFYFDIYNETLDESRVSSYNKSIMRKTMTKTVGYI